MATLVKKSPDGIISCTCAPDQVSILLDAGWRRDDDPAPASDPDPVQESEPEGEAKVAGKKGGHK
jgi:hypothetical protein